MAKNPISLEDIKSIDHHILADMVYELLDRDPLIHQKIESLLLAGKPSQLHQNIAKRIASIQRGRRFIEYRYSFDFAEDINAIIEDIERFVVDKKEALKLLKKLILTDEKVYERCDDSGGFIQNSYAYAQELWRMSAAKNLSDVVLLKELDSLLVLEGYGMRDILCEDMSPSVLTKLYDQTLQKYLSADKEFSGYTWQHILKELAHFLKSPELYHKALNAKGTEIHGYEYLDIAKEYRLLEDARHTLEYLSFIKEPDFTIKDEYFETLIWAYGQLKNEASITKAYKQWYERGKSAKVFLTYLGRLDKEDAGRERKRALEEDIQELTFSQKIDFFMTLEEKPLCAEYIRKNPEQIETEYLYNDTFKQVVQWLKKEYPQEAVLLYRNRVENALKGSISKYYPGAIKALEKISVIESQHDTSDWYIASNEKYIDELVKIHYRKSKFMELLNETFRDR